MMLKLAYRLGFELALQEEFNKFAGVPGAGFAIPKAEIAKALGKAKPTAPAAKPGLWESIKGWFTGPAPEPTKLISHVNLPRGAGAAPRSSYRGGGKL